MLVPSEDPPALASAVAQVLGDPALARGLGANAREYAQRYDWNVLAGEVLGVYDRVLDDVVTHA